MPMTRTIRDVLICLSRIAAPSSYRTRWGIGYDSAVDHADISDEQVADRLHVKTLVGAVSTVHDEAAPVVELA